LTGALELLVHVAAGTIYGTPEKPRPAYLRGLVRVVAFAGAMAVFAALAGAVDLGGVPRLVFLPWALCGLIVILAEYELGSKWIGITAWAVVVALFVVGLVWTA
jgi:hypothetical protein